MIEILERTHETVGLDEQTRTRFAVSALFYRENRTPIGHLFRYWNACRKGVDDLPRVADFQPLSDLQPAVASAVSWVDVRAESPADFIMRDHRPSPITGHGIELSDRPFSSYPNALHAQACMMEYLFCKLMREPMYHEIQQIIGGVARHYLRLLVPVSDDAERVSQIYYAIRAVRGPVRLFHVEVDARD